MKADRLILFIGISAMAVTAGCSARPKVEDGQYWQRVHASESVYINGPKAQHLLNRDISRCVTDLRELEKLGQLRDAIPTDTKGQIITPDEMKIRSIDTPEREGYIYAEHKNYHNFEDCMAYAGWERVKTLTYAATERAEQNYYANHVDYKDGKKPDVTNQGQKASLENDDFND